MEIFNIICGICSIVGLLVSLFTASKVIKISKTFNCDNGNVQSKTANKNFKSEFHGDYVGGSIVNGKGSSEQK